MKILIDISHPAHVNFFKNVIINLKQEGHQVRITVLNRGKLAVIAKDVFKDFDVKVINRHRGTKWSIIVEANILKFFTLFWICLRYHPDIGMSAGSFVLGAILKILRIPNIQFDDDPERKINVLLEKATSTFLFFPLFYSNISHNVNKYNALKEWSYLSPKYFNPLLSVITNYGLKTRNYIFVREVSVGSLNYSEQRKNIIATISNHFPQNFKIVLSLEDKNTVSQYPGEWIILNEPVEDIHSLIYFSKVVISSGDSMAREGALLGVPSIYCGIRKMAANKVMTDKKMLLHLDINEVCKTINDIINDSLKFQEQASFRMDLLKEWDDVNRFMLNKIELFRKK